MTIPPPDPRRFLLESIPDRFAKLTPESFAAFVQYLFQLDGYEVQDIVQSSTFGPHLRALKDGSPLVILPVHLSPDALVTKEVIQKAMQARDLYHLQQAWVITTSAFNPDARLLAELHDVEIWDWDELYTAICHLFFDGKSHLEYIAPATLPVTYTEDSSLLKLKVKWEAQEGIGTEWFNLQLQVTNPTSANLYVHFELPVLLDAKKTQISAEEWGAGEFVSGMIYSGATVKTNALFKVSKLGDRPAGGKVILTCHERHEVLVTHHLSARLKGEACYFVTYCFSRNSTEYMLMINYRDEVLARTWYGKSCIQLYYLVSPFLVHHAGNFKWIDQIVRKFTFHVVRFVTFYYLSKKSTSEKN